MGFLFLGVAAVLLSAGAEMFAENAASAGRRLGVGTLTMGLLLAGAEPEELVTAVTASLRGQPGIAIGDALGANIALTTLVIGALALIRPLQMVGRIRTYALTAAGAAGVAAVVVLGIDTIGVGAGVALVALYIVIVAVVWIRSREVPAFGEVAEAIEHEQRAQGRSGTSPTFGLILAVGGVVLMGVGGWFAVSGAERTITSLDLEGSVVGLTFVALATTAEFVALLVSAARRGTSELAVAAVFGSVLYNATVTLGGAAIAGPLASDSSLVSWAAVIGAVMPVVVVLLAGGTARLGRWSGAILVAGYVAFVGVVIL